MPFLASALLVFVGLYVRLRLTETPAFQRAIENNERVRVPMATVIVNHPRTLVLGTFAATATFVLFYLMTVFSLSWATTALKFPRTRVPDSADDRGGVFRADHSASRRCWPIAGAAAVCSLHATVAHDCLRVGDGAAVRIGDAWRRAGVLVPRAWR